MKLARGVFCVGKKAISREPIYNNSQGSLVLFEACSTVLRMRVLRAKYTESMKVEGPLCNATQETVRHVVQNCPDQGTSAVHAHGSREKVNASNDDLGNGRLV